MRGFCNLLHVCGLFLGLVGCEICVFVCFLLWVLLCTWDLFTCCVRGVVWCLCGCRCIVLSALVVCVVELLIGRC